ncbi:hypothetical protein L9W92_09790 [Pelotomaculum terephthalicicum JT]|uniref:hypothetical protein n=1 Tax=Pelotomaculum TaxID=191373 RepID=UPI0009D37FB5|nr:MULTISPECIES: hypothetical protein [Pelotomaculum]MCG9968343.1 hypothetical protein [Pelotomaculum terephthalicicum JT]OPX87548.1 MAG: hypothetical protein A4E54_01611 [Pelotomaculum sp. PtaB.Bin117]OPY60792.1 MAG: hypothetical protein A4E56_02476 [Pelotomaculum sp. PtaU1.Bin065]
MNRQKLLGVLVAGIIALTGCSQTASNDPPAEEEEQQEDVYYDDEGYYDDDGHFIHTGKIHSGGKSKITSSSSKGLGSSAKGSVSS